MGPPTAGDAEHTHDADDGGVDGQRGVHLNLLQRDAHDGQQDNGQVQLVPPGQQRAQLSTDTTPEPTRARAGVSCLPPALVPGLQQPQGARGCWGPPTNLSLKNRRSPKATSFSTASMTKTMVNT